MLPRRGTLQPQKKGHMRGRLSRHRRRVLSENVKPHKPETAHPGFRRWGSQGCGSAQGTGPGNSAARQRSQMRQCGLCGSGRVLCHSFQVEQVGDAQRAQQEAHRSLVPVLGTHCIVSE